MKIKNNVGKTAFYLSNQDLFAQYFYDEKTGQNSYLSKVKNGKFKEIDETVASKREKNFGLNKFLILWSFE